MNFIIIMYHLADSYEYTSYDSTYPYQINKVRLQQFIDSEPLDFISIVEAGDSKHIIWYYLLCNY